MPARRWRLSPTIRCAALTEARADLPAAMRCCRWTARPISRMRDGEGTRRALVARGQRSRLAVLYLGHHRPAQGRDAEPRQSGGDVAGAISPMSIRRPDDAIAVRRADLARRGALQLPACPHGGGRHVVPESEGLRSGRSAQSRPRSSTMSSMFAAPTMVRRLVDAAKRRGENGEGIRTIIYGGGPMYRRRYPRRASPSWASASCRSTARAKSPMTITALSRECARETESSALSRTAGFGRPAQSVVEVRITDADGKAAAGRRNRRDRGQGSAGDAWLLEQPEGQCGDAEGTAGCVPAMSARLDEDGFLTLSDRSKDVIISGGTNIYPREVEEALLTHPDVREVSAIGAPDPDWGEIVVACVVLEAGATPDDAALDAHCLASSRASSVRSATSISTSCRRTITARC